MICKNMNCYIKSSLMWLFSMRKSLSRAHLPVRSVQVLVKQWHYCHMYGHAHELRERKFALIKNQTRENGLVIRRLTATSAPYKRLRRSAPCGAKPFSKLICSESLNPALCARSLKAVHKALACSTSPGWHRGRPGSHRQGARNHHAELPTPAAAAPTRPAT